MRGDFVEDEYYQKTNEFQCYVHMTCNTPTPGHPSAAGIGRNLSCELHSVTFIFGPCDTCMAVCNQGNCGSLSTSCMYIVCAGDCGFNPTQGSSATCNWPTPLSATICLALP